MLSLAVVFQPAPAGAQENGATVSSVVFTSPAKTYAIGDTIEVTVTFSEAVTVTEAGTDKPQIEIDVGGTPRQAEYESGSGTAALVFGYTVAAGDADSDGIAIGADKLTTPGASAIQASGTDASLRHSVVGTDATRTVDGVPLPAVTIAGGEEVTEGVAAVFTLSRTGDAAEALTVTVEVQQEFAVTTTRVPEKLFGEPPTTVTFDAGHATASLSLPTVDDALADYDVVVTVAIGAGPNYSPGPSAATATVLVREDDPRSGAPARHGARPGARCPQPARRLGRRADGRRHGPRYDGRLAGARRGDTRDTGACRRRRADRRGGWTERRGGWP